MIKTLIKTLNKPLYRNFTIEALALKAWYLKLSIKNDDSNYE